MKKYNDLAVFEIEDFEIHLPSPVPVSGKGYVAFLQHSRTEDGYGWYYTSYDAASGEGRGWFGSETEPTYYFEDAVVDGELRQRTCGVGQGCFWTDWR